jgi:hypothetical protein
MPASSIAAAFRSAANFSSDGEVELFRKLSKAIESGSSSLFVEETHGAVAYNVEFTLTAGSKTRCEIADLLIISRSDFVPFYRATFWQAKKQSTSKWVSRGTADRHVDFKGQFNQWDLLSRRPAIAGIYPFRPPGDLLSSFGSASIGSFGVFYERASQIELAYSVAEFISCSSPKAQTSAMVVNGYIERYVYNGSEVLVRTELQAFLDALLHHQVGAPLDLSMASHRWLLAYARTKASAVAQDRELADFFDDADDLGIELRNGEDGLSVLLVDTRGGE